ncbi:IS256 family transposase [Pseudogemmobacter sp. W21_MBD1_M6]|uniref:IS256 family transposase n=1 Tax=Pseudogemmobacter sp. W21_MBD1_M6 TaxID=3240271 RepID=UPI003F9B9D91
MPPYVHRTKTLEAALPWLYLKGISSGEMGAALKVLLGPDAAGLSANTVSRLKRDWAKEYDGWRAADLDDEPIVYIWANGVHSGLRGGDDKLCALVIVGVTARGKKRFLAIEDGVRESTQSWREVLLSLKSRGMNAPKLAIGDGAMGFWAAMDEVYPETRHQRCWQHKTMNVLNCLPKLSQPKAKAAIHDIWQAETKDDANKAFDLFTKPANPNTPRRRRACKKTAKNSWHSSTSQPSIGKASAPAIRLNPPSPRSGTAPHQASKGLPFTRWYAAHDVQARPMRRAKLGEAARL